MVSILIPVYNFNVRQLVTNLHEQCLAQQIEFEIYCIDDCSTQIFADNKDLAQLSNCVFDQLTANIGRSKIRNLLAEKAKYNNLIFMDCDSAVPDSNYISNYVPHFNKDYVVFGGRNYLEKPTNSNEMLRWKYGVERESVSAKQRALEPYRYFMTNNFLCSKSLFNNVCFDETIDGYGYEDSAFGYSIKQLGTTIKHIDNPLIHIGLESNEAFLDKTKNALKNLAIIGAQNKIDTDIKVYRIALKITKFGCRFLFNISYKIFKTRIEKNLQSNNPNLTYFDLYKLNELLRSL